MNPWCFTISVGVPLTAEDAVLFPDVRAAQNNVLSSFCVSLAHPATITETILRAGALPLCQQALGQNARSRKIHGHKSYKRVELLRHYSYFALWLLMFVPWDRATTKNSGGFIVGGGSLDGQWGEVSVTSNSWSIRVQIKHALATVLRHQPG